jgi:hypothetical protein
VRKKPRVQHGAAGCSTDAQESEEDEAEEEEQRVVDGSDDDARRQIAPRAARLRRAQAGELMVRLRFPDDGGDDVTRTVYWADKPEPLTDKQFALERVAELDDMAEGFTWSPWRDRNMTRPDRERGDSCRAQLARWRLRGDLLRLATYYRVTGSHERARTRQRRDTLRSRARAWMRSALEELRRPEPPAPASAEHRWEMRERNVRPHAYIEVRQYRERASAEQLTHKRLVSRKRKKMATAQTTEMGKRMRDAMATVADRCKRQRRGCDG